MNQPLLKMTDLCKWYGRVLALNRFELEIQRGEVVAFMGHNGAGKSSLLHILATLVRFDKGTLQFDGRELRRNLGYVRKQIGVVLHEPMLYNKLSARENLHFTAEMFGLAEHGDIGKRVEMMIDLLQIRNFENQRIDSLSNGMRKRVSIARALIHEPTLLLLDEPETGLDKAGIEIVKNLVSKYRSENKTVIVASHNAELLSLLCDRLVVFELGIKTQDIINPTSADWRSPLVTV